MSRAFLCCLTCVATTTLACSSSTKQTNVSSGVVPGAPTSVAATMGGPNTITVTWSPPANVGSSPIESYTATCAPPALTISTITGPGTSATFSLSNGVAYTFTVFATNAAGNGPVSAASDPVVALGTPSAPLGVYATAGVSSAAVAWETPVVNGGASIVSFTITPSPSGEPVVVQGAAATSGTVTGLVQGTTYTFTVFASNSVGAGDVSATSNPVAPFTVPNPPTDVVAVAAPESATITWQAPDTDGGAPITGYTVTPSTSEVAGTPVMVSGTQTQAEVTGLADGTTYTFAVVATDEVGSSAPVISNAVTTPVAPDAPTGVMAVAGDLSATVSWTAPNDGGSPITSYTVTVLVHGSAVSMSMTTATSIMITGLTNGTPYTFTVIATNAVGSSPASAATDPVTPVPGPSDGGQSE